MKLSVATNFDNYLPGLISPHGAVEIFGKLPKDAAGGGRASYMIAPVSRGRLESHVRSVHRAGMAFNYLINSACQGNHEFTRAGQRGLRELLDWLSEIGVDAVTVSTPYMLEMVKRSYPHFRAKVGVFAGVDTPSKARFVQDLGADCIAVHPLMTVRNFARLKAIRAAVSCELQLIANSCCLLECPLAPYHNVGLSHASQSGSSGFFIDYCLLRCLVTKLSDPVNYIKSPWIRPEDVHYYEDMGYTSFKILERDAPTETLVKRVKAYHSRHYDGNLLDLVQSYGFRDSRSKSQPTRARLWELREFFKPSKTIPTRLLPLKELAKLQGMLYQGTRSDKQFHIDNRALDGFMSRFVSEDCANLNCEDCGHCAQYAEKALRIDEDYRSQSLKLANGLLDDLSSGRMWSNQSAHCCGGES